MLWRYDYQGSIPEHVILTGRPRSTNADWIAEIQGGDDIDCLPATCRFYSHDKIIIVGLTTINSWDIHQTTT